MRHPLIKIFQLSNWLQMSDDHRMVDIQFFANFSCSCQRMEFSGCSQLVVINFRWLPTSLLTKFNALIGPEAEQEKREKMASPAYTPLTTTAKVRPRKLGFSHFGNIRKKKFDESTDYICPMEPSDGVSDSHRVYSGYRDLSPLDAPELDGLDQVGQIS